MLNKDLLSYRARKERNLLIKLFFFFGSGSSPKWLIRYANRKTRQGHNKAIAEYNKRQSLKYRYYPKPTTARWWHDGEQPLPLKEEV